VGRVAALMEHPAFDITSPSACEHLLFGFAASVPNFHAEDGSGYAFMAGAILKVRGLLHGGGVLWLPSTQSDHAPHTQ
jgi:hypothetical protein